MFKATLWIDVCPNNGNLLASGGDDRNIKIFDKRVSTIVKTFDHIHSGMDLQFFFNIYFDYHLISHDWFIILN